MAQYELVIEFDSRGVTQLDSKGEQVAIVRTAPPTLFPVICYSFLPMERNFLSWNADYFLYVTETKGVVGNVIRIEDASPAAGGTTYTYSSGHFARSSYTLDSDQYGLIHQDPELPTVNAGLAQDIGMDSTITILSPINLEVIPFDDLALFTASEKLRVFTMAEVRDGLILDSIPRNSLEVDLSDHRQQVIHYNTDLSTFQEGPLPE